MPSCLLKDSAGVDHALQLDPGTHRKLFSIFYRPAPDLIDPSTLAMVQPHERIVGPDETAVHVAPFYNQAQLSPESTQDERHAVFTAALRKLIDSGTLIPRARPADGRLCLVMTASKTER
jgi:hypothetical protein